MSAYGYRKPETTSADMNYPMHLSEDFSVTSCQLLWKLKPMERARRIILLTSHHYLQAATHFGVGNSERFINTTSAAGQTKPKELNRALEAWPWLISLSSPREWPQIRLKSLWEVKFEELKDTTGLTNSLPGVNEAFKNNTAFLMFFCFNSLSFSLPAHFTLLSNVLQWWYLSHSLLDRATSPIWYYPSLFLQAGKQRASRNAFWNLSYKRKEDQGTESVNLFENKAGKFLLYHLEHLHWRQLLKQAEAFIYGRHNRNQKPEVGKIHWKTNTFQ